jgi:hypothetical protein
MSFIFNSEYPDATNEQKWEQIRLWRNVQLSKTDFTQLPDSPLNQQAWAAYRQALRDLPAQGGDANKATFPSKPA